jgi:methylphosphotriester-DNA--protein-cysteine methyltransferase
MHFLRRSSTRVTNPTRTARPSLGRVSVERIGLSPKRFARIARLQRLLQTAAVGAPWAQLACNHGIADQAHLVKEFRDLLISTPTAFFAQR